MTTDVIADNTPPVTVYVTYSGRRTNLAPRMVRRGHFRISGERFAMDGKTYQRGPMYVEWEAAEHVTHHWPVVLMHGGGFQRTEWFDTPRLPRSRRRVRRRLHPMNACGASAELMNLAEHGVHGNGHGLIYEKNADAAPTPVLEWITQNTQCTSMKALSGMQHK